MIPNLHPDPRAGQRYRNLMRLMGVAHKIEGKGWLLDRAKLEEHRALAEHRVLKFKKMFLATTKLSEGDLGAAGSGTTNRVRDWFWVGEGAPLVVFNKLTKKPQFSTEALIIYATTKEYAEQRFGRAAAMLYGLRKNKKALEFLNVYDIFARADGRVHFSFNCAGTQTGRWTSSTKMRVAESDGSRTTYSCNAQQVPSKAPKFDFGEGPEQLVSSLRDIFIADPGHVLLKSDFEGLELRLIAYVHGAQRVIEWIESGADTHMSNAVAIFKELGLPHDACQTKPAKTELERLANAARDAAKPLAYGVSYQMHSERGENNYPTLFKTLKKIFPSMTQQQANTYAARFFELHPEIKRGQTRVRKQIERDGFSELAIDGRRLHYPSSSRGQNQALNFTMQGTGAALVNRALLEIDEQLDWEGNEVRAQVHDELVVQCRRSELDRVADLVEKAMGREAQLGAVMAGVPALADPGLSWGTTMARAKFEEKHPWLTSPAHSPTPSSTKAAVSTRKTPTTTAARHDGAAR